MGLIVDIKKKLNNITLQVQFDTGHNQGISGILGVSGCGKSMTLKSIAGIITPDSGRIVLNDRVLFDSEQGINARIQSRRVGYLFQNYALFPTMTVEENIRIVIPGDKRKKEEISARYLELLQIQELHDRYPAKLSGGQQQRVALARILASQPDVLMLDEPFSAMDTFLKERLQIELLHMLEGYRGEILMVTHSRDEVYRFCNQMYVLEQGHVVTEGKTKDVFKNPELVAAARLTGCKNIVGARRISEHQLEVPDWNLRFFLKQEIPLWTDHIGIRAHYLEPVENATGQMEPVIACRWSKIVEDPFEITGILENGVWWKISKEDWKQILHQKMPKYLRIPEESILFLREGTEHEDCISAACSRGQQTVSWE